MLIAHFDWLPLQDNVVEATEQLICKYNPEWAFAGGSGLYPDWLRDVRCEGFGEVETFSFDVAQTFSHRDWRGRIRASAGVGASMAADMVARFDESLRALLHDRFPKDPLQIDHRVWALVCRAPGSDGAKD